MNPAKTCIGLLNPKSPDNVASVLRAAGNYRVNNVFYTGTRYPRAAKLNPCTVDMSRKVSKDIAIAGVEHLIDDTPDNLDIVCIEFAENAIALPVYKHPHDALYVFGPEDGTISQNIIDRADAVVYVPTVGCMNLAATVNVVLYDRLAKSANEFSSLEGNRLIRESRDVNNCLKVD
jgi:tRNA(Leu) C34 or U34 (ribose-2'-O)-methylase TrmL